MWNDLGLSAIILLTAVAAVIRTAQMDEELRMGVRYKRSLGGMVFDAANYGVLFIFALLCFYPFYYILIYSLSHPAFAERGLTLFPVRPTLMNYVRIMELPGIGRAAYISVARTIIQTGLMVFCSGLLGYVLSRPELGLRKAIYRFFIVTMYFSGGLIPTYLLMRWVGLFNNFFVYIVPGVVAVFNMILVKTYIEQLPSALEDSAKIDGASYLTVFFKIIVPLSMPILATIAVFGAVGQWNSWWDNLMYVPDRKLRTLQYALWAFLQDAARLAGFTAERGTELISADGRMELTPRSIQMTMTMVVTLPILFVYPIMQRYFVKGIMIGAIKA